MNEYRKDKSNRGCARCGAELPAGLLADLCPKCLLEAGLETQPAPGLAGTVALPPFAVDVPGLPQSGDELGHYRIIKLLGQGGMGAAFEAEDLETGRRVAL